MAAFTYCKQGTPCAVCGATKNCRRNGTLHFCRYRLSEHDYSFGYQFVGQDRDGTFGMWVHENDLDNDRERIHIDRRSFARPAATVAAPPVDDPAAVFHCIAREMVPLAGAQLTVYLAQTGLPADVLPQLSASSWKDRWGRACAVVPEIGADGSIVAYALRYPDRYNDRGDLVEKGRKLSYGRPTASPKRGLNVPAGLEEASGPVWMVEGPTDTMALTAMGIPVVGRPNNQAGAEAAAALLERLGGNRGAVVVGENDRKEDGTWPGREGPLKFAAKLAAITGQVVRVVFPPEGFKDSRDWFRKHSEGPTAAPRYTLGNRYEALCLAGEVIEVRPTAPETIAQAERYDAALAAELRAERDFERSIATTKQCMADFHAYCEALSDRDATLVPLAAECASEEALADSIRQSYRDHIRYPCEKPTSHMIEVPGGWPYEVVKRCGKCQACIRRRIDATLARVRHQLDDLDRRSVPCYEFLCDPEDWDTIRKQMSRLQGEDLRYHRLAIPGGQYYVVTTAGPGLPTNAQHVLCELEALFAQHFHGPRIFYSSRGWEEVNLHEDDEVRGRYLYPCPPIDNTTAQDIAGAVGATVEVKPIPGGALGDTEQSRTYRRACGWDEEAKAWFHAMRRAGELLPPSSILDYDPDDHSPAHNGGRVHGPGVTSVFSQDNSG